MGSKNTQETVFEKAGIWANVSAGVPRFSYIPEARPNVRVNSIGYVTVDLHPKALLAIWTWVQDHLGEIKKAVETPELPSPAEEPEVIVGHRTDFQAP